ncbi:putative HTH-type transcriptional regulator [compost metagenome]
MALGSRIRYYREKAGFTLDQLSERSNVDVGTISALENRDSSRSKFASAIASALGMTVEMLENEAQDYNVKELISGSSKWDGNVVDAPTPPVMRKYPLISYVQAGEYAECIDSFQPGDAESFHYSPKDLGKNGYLLRVEGDSMTDPTGPISFPNGMMLHIHPDIEAMPGNFVVAKRVRENQATFKQLVMVDGELYLHAINPNWPTPYIKLVEGDVIIGRLKFAGWDF